jgi:hypothetical protein
MGKKNNNNISEMAEAIQFFRSAINQVPNENQVIMSLLVKEEKTLSDQLINLEISKLPKREKKLIIAGFE